MTVEDFISMQTFETLMRALQEHAAQNFSSIKIILVSGIAVFFFYMLKKFEIILNKKHENAFIYKVRAENKLLDEVFVCSTLCNERQHMNRCLSLVMKAPNVVNIPREPFGSTPFLNVCWAGCTPLVRFMLRNGANLTRKTKSGDSALLLAVQALIDFDVDSAELRLLNILHLKGCDVNEANYNGYTGLHMAAAAGNTNVVKWLLDHGADASLKTLKGETVRQLAESKGHLDVVQMLPPALTQGRRKLVLRAREQ
ncbi:ankyrin repeat family A protein 2-like [Cloeon dipterum]|uniref:ankyrin repeat family A protein 2-like n=1 Tax=Cloeon dipterum TaxID=197152 RepID=UPI00321F6D79